MTSVLASFTARLFAFLSKLVDDSQLCDCVGLSQLESRSFPLLRLFHGKLARFT